MQRAVAVDIRMQSARVRQNGFSLIELIVVICVVVFVIAQILPYAEKNLKQAHETAVQLSARALHDGIERAKAIQMLDGLSGSVYNLPRFGEGTLDLSQQGFPIGTTRKPGDHLRVENCAEIWDALLESDIEEVGKNTESNYRITLGTEGKKTICVYSYVHSGKMSISYDPATGKVWADAQFKGSGFFN